MNGPPGYRGYAPPPLPGGAAVAATQSTSLRPGLLPTLPPGVDINSPVIYLGGSEPRAGMAAVPAAGIPSTGAVSAVAAPVTVAAPTVMPPTVPTGPSRARAHGLSLSMQSKAFVRESMTPRAPPTAEEQMNTVCVGSIPKCLANEWVEKLVRSVGKLKEWRRAMNHAGAMRPFGFAIYEEPESTSRAFTILSEMKLPPLEEQTDDLQLQIVLDEKSKQYLEQYEETRPNKNPVHDRNLMISARSFLDKVLQDLADPVKRAGAQPDPISDPFTFSARANGDGLIVPPTNPEELNDVPAEQRDLIIGEIQAFRRRTAERERERAFKEEEELEKRRQMDRLRELRQSGGNEDVNLDSKPTIKDTRRKSSNEIQPVESHFRKEHDEADLSEEDDLEEEEYERRRLKRIAGILDREYQERLKRWLSRESHRNAGLEKEVARHRMPAKKLEEERLAMAKYHAEFDDEQESIRRKEKFYDDRSAWLRHRASFKAKEERMDEEDREEERRSMVAEAKAKDAAQMADQFLAERSNEIATPAQEPLAKPSPAPGPIRLSFGGIKKTDTSSPASSLSRPILSDNEEEEEVAKRRPRTFVGLDDDE